MPDVRPVKSGWFNLFRPWTLHGAVVPVVIATVYAWGEGHMDTALSWGIFVLVLIGAVLLQSASNILNTYGDYRRGVDTLENESRSPELVSGTLTPEKVKLAGLGCLGVTALIGLVLIWYSDWGLLIIGLLGIAGASGYTYGLLAYKYHAMGQPMCFLMMGMLEPIGTYYTLTSGFSLELVLMALPNAFMITGVLCGNETRDYHDDKAAGVNTLCSHLPYEGAMRLYWTENLVGYPVLALLIAFGIAPWTCALAFLALYDGWRLYSNSRLAPTDPGRNRLMVPMAFTQNWHFGALLAAGLALATLI